MERLNCWEVMDCGREPEGFRADDDGICPAAINTTLEGVHGGISAGRACWVVAGTMCDGRSQGTFAQKSGECGACRFYNRVKDEEGEQFLLTVNLLRMVREQ